MAYVSLKKMPSPKKEYVVSFEHLNGGLNLQELDYRIGNNESPEMKNLLWREGVLSCRDGQVWVNSTVGDEFHARYDRLWNDKMFIHSGKKLYAVDPVTGVKTALYTGSTDMTVGGTFFLYNEKLYYKTRGYYVEIVYTPPVYPATEGTFAASDVSGYTPVTYINCSPINGSGTVYQPENRLSADKTLWYNSDYDLVTTVTGDIVATVEYSYFRMRINDPGVYTFVYDAGEWTLDGAVVDPLDYGVFVTGYPVDDDTVEVKFMFTDQYYLPEKDMDITSITVAGEELEPDTYELSSSREALQPSLDDVVWHGEITASGNYVFAYDTTQGGWVLGSTLVDLDDYGISYTFTGDQLEDTDYILVKYTKGDYWVDSEKGVVNFYSAPRVYYPEINNTVHITYSKENELARENIMDCVYAAVYGGTGTLCVVMAGCTTQPNAYFWNGQTSISMDPSYFPMTQYQLAGDGVDPITGFGKQQGYLIIFKDKSIGRTSIETQTVEDRLTIDLAYTAINARIGCDLPGTIQLVENNLVWCNTDQGVHFLANTSSAYENNVVRISDKINESSSNWTMGLLFDVRKVSVNLITSHDDDKRYWLVANGHAWLWDYEISNYKDPAWFYFDNINGVGFVQDYDDIWHFDKESRLTKFRRLYYDYDPSENGTGAIDKVFRFATQYFGTYDNMKNVNSVIINTRSDTNTIIDLKYLTDWEDRMDLTPLRGVAWMLVPRNLDFRNLKGSGFAHIFRRKPHCRRVQYFTMRLENNIPAMDMSIVSAQIYYTFQGRQR